MTSQVTSLLSRVLSSQIMACEMSLEPRPQAYDHLTEVEKDMRSCVTESMWNQYAQLRKTQQRIINAVKEGDREISGKLRPGMEKQLKAAKDMFLSTEVGSKGHIAG